MREWVVHYHGIERNHVCISGTGLSIEGVCYTWRLELVSYKLQKRNGGGMLHSLIRPLS